MNIPFKPIGAAAAALVPPAGVWFSKGPIALKSRIELRVAKGATLLFGSEPKHYLPAVETGWEGTAIKSARTPAALENVAHPTFDDVTIDGQPTDGTLDRRASGDRSPGGNRPTKVERRNRRVDRPIDPRRAAPSAGARDRARLGPTSERAPRGLAAWEPSRRNAR